MNSAWQGCSLSLFGAFQEQERKSHNQHRQARGGRTPTAFPCCRNGERLLGSGKIVTVIGGDFCLQALNATAVARMKWRNERRFHREMRESPNTYERCQVSFGRFIVDYIRWSWGLAGFSDRTPYPSGKRSDGVRSEKSAGCLNVGLWNVSTSKDWAYGSASASKLLSVHPSSDRSDNLTYSSA